MQWALTKCDAFCITVSMERLNHIWPTMADLARDLAVPYPTVQSWASRGIPARRWTSIIEAAKARGHVLTVEKLHSFAFAQDADSDEAAA
jgi:hypothetical protein